MKMFKVILNTSWKDKNGNWSMVVKHVKSESIEAVKMRFGTDNIWLVEEC